MQDSFYLSKAGYPRQHGLLNQRLDDLMRAGRAKDNVLLFSPACLIAFTADQNDRTMVVRVEPAVPVEAGHIDRFLDLGFEFRSGGKALDWTRDVPQPAELATWRPWPSKSRSKSTGSATTRRSSSNAIQIEKCANIVAPGRA